jgi:hypothetical protein
MPLHDWTRVDDGIFHAFHVAWIPLIQKALNGGLLPEGFYALAEQHAGRSIADVLTLHARRRSLAIRHVSGHRLVALIEIISPANKDRRSHVEEFVDKAESALHRGVHVLLVDLLPPGPHDPCGIHGALLQRLEDSDEPYDLPAAEPATLASYVAGPVVEVYLEHLAVGTLLPEMPLFLHPERYINVPLEPTYQSAYAGMPAFWRNVLEDASRGDEALGANIATEAIQPPA